MTQICVECSCVSSTFDERLGESVCDDCGLVQIVRPFEETVSWVSAEGNYEPTNGKLGSQIMGINSNHKSNQMYRMKKHNIWASSFSQTEKRTYTQCMMILSNYSVGKGLKENVSVYMNSLNNEHVFRGITVEHRAASITYYILKEAGITVNLTRHSDISKVERKYISRYAKRIAKHFRKSHVFANVNSYRIASTIIDRLDNVSTNYRMKSLRMIDHLDKYCSAVDIRFSPNKICAVLWAVSVMEDERHHTQELICEASGNSSVVGMRTSLKEICDWFNLTKKDLLSLEVLQFINGVYK